MSPSWMKPIARRPLLAGTLALLGLGIAGGIVVELPRLVGKHYPRTRFDDLLDQLGDRDSAAKLGSAVLAEEPRLDTQRAAAALRHGDGHGILGRAIETDIALGRLRIVHGWVLPEALVLVSAIAARPR